MAGSMTVEDAIGTVIHGTLLPADLLQAFLAKLKALDGERAQGIRHEYANVFAHLSDLGDAWSCESDEDGQSLIIDAGECFETLYDALNEHAPEGLFFGSHPGDGSDFGFWPIESHDTEEPQKQERQRDASEKNRNFARRYSTRGPFGTGGAGWQDRLFPRREQD